MTREEKLERWCNALESGHYKQGSGALQAGGCFCCLGVLCDISELGDWDVETGYDTELAYRVDDSTKGSGVLYPPEPVLDWIGLTARETAGGSRYSPVVGGRRLADMNDDGASFAEIAAWIRQHKGEP